MRISHWFRSKTRLVRYGVPASLVVLILSVTGVYFSWKANDEGATVFCVVAAIMSFIAFGVITVEDGGTVVIKR